MTISKKDRDIIASLRKNAREKVTIISRNLDVPATTVYDKLRSFDKKYVKRHKTYMVHDPKNACQIGDKVKIIESRPVSKMKRWQVIELLEGGVKEVADRVIDERSEPGNDSDANEVESG